MSPAHTTTTPSPPSTPAICTITPPNQRRSAHYRELGLAAAWHPQRMGPVVQAPVLRSIRQRCERARAEQRVCAEQEVQVERVDGCGADVFRTVREEHVRDRSPATVVAAENDEAAEDGRRRSRRLRDGEKATELVALGPRMYKKRGLKRKTMMGRGQGGEAEDVKEPKEKKVMLRLRVPESFSMQEPRMTEERGLRRDRE